MGGKKRIGLELDLATGEANRQLDDLEKRIKAFEKAEKGSGNIFSIWSANARRGILETQKDLTKELHNLPRSLAKSALEDVATSLGRFREAVSAPARTTLEGAAASAKRWQGLTQTAAVAIGKDFNKINGEVMRTAKATGELPESVLNWGRSIRQMGTSWKDAIGGVEVFQDRALQTDRTLGQLLPTAETLTEQFGIRKSSDVSQFFNALDSNAKRAGISVEVMERSVMALADTLGTLGMGKSGEGAALIGDISKRAKTPAQAARAQSALLNIPEQHLYGLESRMRGAGMLGKNEYLTDDEGQMKPGKMLDAVELLQKKLPGYLHSKDRRDLVAKMGRTFFGPGVSGRQTASLVLGMNVPALRKQMQESAMDSFFQSRGESLNSYRKTDTFKGTIGEIEKDERDRVEVGNQLLSLQRQAVRGGGGQVGVALNDKTVSGAATVGAMFDEGVNWGRKKLGMSNKTDEQMSLEGGFSSMRSQIPEAWEGVGNAQSIREAAQASGPQSAVITPESATAIGKAVGDKVKEAMAAPGLAAPPGQTGREQ